MTCSVGYPMYATSVSDPAYLSHLAAAIDAAMDYRGVSALELAQSVGVDRQTVYRWVLGHNKPGPVQLHAVADALDAPGDLFIRPPDSRGEAMAMMAAWDELRGRGR